uniref:Uncharacterized protein n=1 Tax=Anguilla anguilla TaxID=7936 RepID=A0A0E9THB1_ANGAN
MQICLFLQPDWKRMWCNAACAFLRCPCFSWTILLFLGNLFSCTFQNMDRS